jgi:hypothetical protein
MIWRDDLIDGLYSLTMADAATLTEPDGGYAMAGLSFTALELFAEIKKRVDTFEFATEKDTEKLMKESPAALFAKLWVDRLTPAEATRDLGFTSTNTDIGVIIDRILEVWNARC